MKKVIVTGSSRGIGRAIAEALKGAGYEVVTHSVRSGGTDLQFDIADREAAKAALDKWVAENGAPYAPSICTLVSLPEVASTSPLMWTFCSHASPVAQLIYI